MIPKPVPDELTEGSICTFRDTWKISTDLAEKLVVMNMHCRRYYGFSLNIISGWRSVERQIELRSEGRPAADPSVSTHCSCPATGADLETVPAAVDMQGKTNIMKLQFGQAARMAGLRWGGGSPQDPNTGIPSDWNHVDTGPRQQ